MDKKCQFCKRGDYLSPFTIPDNEDCEAYTVYICNTCWDTLYQFIKQMLPHILKQLEEGS